MSHHRSPRSAFVLSCLICLSSGFTLSMAAPGRAAVVYVNQNAPGATHDGATWATAFLKMQEGLSAAKPGDEVWVARGSYAETFTLTPGVALYGGFAGGETERRQRDWRSNEAVLTAAIPSNVVAYSDSGNAVLNGFTLKDSFGGVQVSGVGTVTIANNRFSGLETAVYISSGTAVVSRNTIRSSRTAVGIRGGVAMVMGNVLSANGVGIEIVGGSLNASNNTVCANTMGVTYSDSTSNVTLSSNIIAFNTGIGLYAQSATLVVLSSNDVYGNDIANYYGTPDATGQNGNISADPELSNIYHDFHIQPDSPCRDSGDPDTTLEAFYDIDSEPRLQGAGLDMGADESDGATQTVPARIWYVAVFGDDTSDGLSWARARKTVTSALSSARGGDEVWVAKGMYEERLKVPAGVALYGGFAGTESTTVQRNIPGNPTSLDGVRAAIPVVECPFGVVVVDGFAIRGGATGIRIGECKATIANNTITDITGDGISGGAFPTIINNSITFSGGRGIHVPSGGNIIGNTVNGNAGYGIAVGGFFYDSTLTNNIISVNTGSGVLITGSATLTDNTIQRNRYGVEIASTAFPVNLIHNEISGNQLDGVMAHFGPVTLSRNDISDNTGRGVFAENSGLLKMDSNRVSGNTGAGVQVNSGVVATLNNNTLVKGAGAGVIVNGGATRLVNNIIAYNVSFGVRQYGTINQLTMIKNDVFGNVPDYFGVDVSVQQGNFSQDPGIPGLATGDYHLSGKSTLINLGDDAAVQTGALDLDGKPRIIGTAVDLGAYEYGSAGFTLTDILAGLRITGGLLVATPSDLSRLDVADPAAPGISLPDAAQLARKVAGLEANP